MSSSYSTTKLLYPSTKRQKIRIVSSKARPIHKPNRVRFRIACKIEEKSGNGVFTDIRTEVTSTTEQGARVPLKTNLISSQGSHLKAEVTSTTEQGARVPLKTNLISSQGSHLKAKYYSGKSRPSRTRCIAHDFTKKESVKSEAPDKQRSSFAPQQPAFDSAVKAQSSRDRKKPVGACSKLYAPASPQTSLYNRQKPAFGSARTPRLSRYPGTPVLRTVKKETPVRNYSKLDAPVGHQRTSYKGKQPTSRGTTKPHSSPYRNTNDSAKKGRPVRLNASDSYQRQVPVALGRKQSSGIRTKQTSYYNNPPQNNGPRKCAQMVSPASRVRRTQSVTITTERHVGRSCQRPLNVTSTVFPEDPAALNTSLVKFFKEKVSLLQREINRNSEVVNGLLGEILPLIRKQDDRFGLRILNTGSYYEKLKVSRPVEFDVMLVFDAHRFTRFFRVEYSLRDPATARFAKLVYKDYVTEGRKTWGDFLTRDGKCLSPEKLSRHFYKLVRNAIAHMRKIKIQQKGPAVTLTIGGKIDLDLVLSVEIAEWPQPANGWGDFSSEKTWPKRKKVEEIKIKDPKCHLVTKTCPTEKWTSEDSRVLWRISFSEAEKTLLRSKHPGKEYFKIVKAIFQAKEEELHPLSSYDLKNAFLHHLSEHPHVNLWKSVVEFFQSLICRLRKGSLPHFFVSRSNLFADISREHREDIARKMDCFLQTLVKDPESFLRSLNP